jgi:arylsulfatase A-like enzyme
MDAHEPTEPPEPFRSMFPVPDGTPHEFEHLRWSFTELGAQNKPGFENFRNHKISLYDGSVAFVDSQIRRLVELLQARGVLENTVIVIASDHGEELWDHPDFRAKFESHPYGGGAGAHGHSMLGELTDVPLIFYGKGVPQRRVARQVRNLDIMPTLLGIAGIEDPSLQVEGVDLFSRSESASDADLVSYSEDICYGYEVKALSDGRFKYLRYTGHPKSLEFLFDRSIDPNEMEDIASTNSQVLTAMRAATEQMMDANELGRRRGESITFDAEDIEELRALGYIE